MNRIKEVTSSDHYNSPTKLNEVIAAVNKLGKLTVAGGLRLTEDFGGFCIIGNPNPILSTIAEATVKDVEKDYMVCDLHRNGSPTGEYIWVLKPRDLRVSDLDGREVIYENGQTVKYTYNGSVRSRTAQLKSGGIVLATEFQEMTSDYYLDEVIDLISIKSRIVSEIPTLGYVPTDSIAYYMEFNSSKGWAYRIP